MKTGLILEGGGIRTIYSSGVCDGFIEQGLKFDYILGVSAGIAYGISYMSGQFGRNLEVCEKYINDPRYMGFRNMLNPKNRCYFGSDFVYDTIPNKLVPFDYAAYQAYPGEAEAAVTDVHSGETVYFPVDREDRKSMLMRATCALPIMFPIYHYQGVDCMDGGCSNCIPIERALEKGCDRIVIITTREPSYRRQQESAWPLIKKKYGKKYPNFVAKLETRAERYNKQREELFRMEKEGKVFIFCPDSTDGFSRTERDVEKIRALWQNGLDHARKREEELRAYLSENK